MSNGEIDDVLGRGRGSIHALSQRVANAYGARRCVLTLHGSSQVNLSIGMALRAVKGPNVRVLVDRGLHDVAGGLALAHVEDVVWLDQTYDEACGVREPVCPAELDRILKKEGSFDAVILTTPSYDGFLVRDAAELARCANARTVS